MPVSLLHVPLPRLLSGLRATAQQYTFEVTKFTAYTGPQVEAGGWGGVLRNVLSLNYDLHIAIPVVCCLARTDFQSPQVQILVQNCSTSVQKKRNQSEDGSVTKTFTRDSNSHATGMVSPTSGWFSYKCKKNVDINFFWGKKAISIRDF